MLVLEQYREFDGPVTNFRVPLDSSERKNRRPADNLANSGHAAQI